MIQRRKPLVRKTPLKRSGSIRRVSKKRRKDITAYSLLRSAFLSQFPMCAVCEEAPASDVHHTKGRGKHYLDVSSWIPVCRPDHTRIHSNPSWARSNGYLA